MSSVLKEICNKKQDHIESCKSKASIENLKARAADMPAPIGFMAALKHHEFPAIIAEVKKASPSKGIIREDFNPVEIAKIYKDNGAACLSVLTDAPYFQGSDEIFAAVRASNDLPMLRKDFMLEPYQIYESRAMGADCILLIMAALSDDQASELYALSAQLGMDALVEVHDLEETQRALKLKPHMIGVNNRNLKTLEVSVGTSINLAQHIPAHIHSVAESGLKDFETLQHLKGSGYSSFLIGESLMRQDNIGAAIKNIRGR